MKEKFRKLMQLDMAKFVIVGCMTTSIDFAIYMLLSLKISVTIAKCVSMLCASVFSYFVNKKWTFEDNHRTDIWYLVRYYISFACNLGTNVSINTFLVNKTGNKFIAFVLATGCAMVVNYVLQRFFVFRSSKNEE